MLNIQISFVCLIENFIDMDWQKNINLFQDIKAQDWS